MQKRALGRYRSGQKAIHKCATLVLNGYEKSWISAGSAQRRRNCAIQIVNRDTGIDVRRADGQRNFQFGKGRRRCHARKIFFHALVRRQTEPGGSTSAKIGGRSGFAAALPLLYPVRAS